MTRTMRVKPHRVALLFLAVLAFVLTPAVWAQKKPKDDGTRTVTGQVTDKGGNPLPKSVVYLKNTRTLTIQTRIADEAGAFRFNGLDPNIDFEVHAEHDGGSSPVKTISSFDNRKEMTISLKVEKK